MQKKNLERDRKWYQDECYRLKYELKKANEKLHTLKEQCEPIELQTHYRETLRKQKEQIKQLKEEISKFKAKIKTLTENKLENKSHLREINNRLVQENNQLKQELKKFNKLDLAKLNLELNTYKDALSLFEYRNKRIFNDYFERVSREETEYRLPLATVLLDYEFMFTFQKLFEMHVFDYIVDRQNPDTKTERDTKDLILTCKAWTTAVIQNSITKVSIRPEDFKQAFKSFTNKHVEPKWMGWV